MAMSERGKGTLVNADEKKHKEREDSNKVLDVDEH